MVEDADLDSASSRYVVSAVTVGAREDVSQNTPEFQLFDESESESDSHQLLLTEDRDKLIYVLDAAGDGLHSARSSVWAVRFKP